MNWSNFTSRKFLLALAANIVAVVVLIVPKYQSEIVQAVNTGMSLLLMIGASMGWIHEEAKIDAAAAVAKIDGQTQVRLAMAHYQPSRMARMAAAPAAQPDINELVAEVTRILQSVLSGAEADIRVYANLLVMDAYRVAAIPDPRKRDAMLAELASQAALLAEVNRLRAVNAGWDITSKALDLAMRIVVAVLVGYLKAYQSNQSDDPHENNDPNSWNPPAGRPVGLR